MIIPVCCFTCNKVIGHLWQKYQDQLQIRLDSGEEIFTARNNVLLDIGLPPEKYCCRRMILTHVNIIDKLLQYPNNPGEKVTRAEICKAKLI